MDVSNTNINYLSPVGYRMVFSRMPQVIYNLQSVALPSLSTGAVESPTPFASLPQGGDHIEYGPFPMNFKVDSQLINYDEIMAWMQALAPPTDYSQAVIDINNPQKAIIGKGRKSDGILTILTAENNASVYYYFRDLVPVGLSELIFDTRDENITYITGSAKFVYSWFKRTTSLSQLSLLTP